MTLAGAIARVRSYRRAIAVGAVVAVLVWLFVGGSEGLYAQWRMSGELDELRDEIAGLRLENDALREQIERLRTDMEYLERIARESYGMARPGEGVYRVLPTADAEDAPNNEDAPGESE